MIIGVLCAASLNQTNVFLEPPKHALINPHYLNDINVLAPDVLQQPHAGLLVGELDEVRLPYADANFAGDQFG